jgi:hypothetical protein
VVTNFSWLTTSNFELKIPADVITKWNLKDGEYDYRPVYNKSVIQLEVAMEGRVQVEIGPSESFIYNYKTLLVD